MRIDKNFSEKEIAHVHDACFTGFRYNPAKREIQMKMINYCFEKKFFIRFIDVQMFEMQSCEFWAPIERAYYWECVKDISGDTFASSLFRHGGESSSEHVIHTLGDNVESVLSLISGDTLTVVSKYIDFEEQPYPLQKEGNSV